MAESGVVVGSESESVSVSEIVSSVKKRYWPQLHLSSDFDSESCILFHKVSWKLFDSLGKVKLFFQQDVKNNKDKGFCGFISSLNLSTKHLSFQHDFENNNTFINASLHISPDRLQINASHEFNTQQSDLSLLATLPNPNYSINLSTPLSLSLPLSQSLHPKASFKFPLGEISLEETQHVDDYEDHSVSVNAILKANLLNGIYSAQYADRDCKLRYFFKDDQMAFIPSVSLPSNALSFAFKRRFGPSHKLSYWYNFDVNNWSGVYKHTYGKDLKFKAGYDSEVRIGWASLWVGEENGKAKAAPLKMKIQFMLQVPQDDIKSSALMFRVKKRWDI